MIIIVADISKRTNKAKKTQADEIKQKVPNCRQMSISNFWGELETWFFPVLLCFFCAGINIIRFSLIAKKWDRTNNKTTKTTTRATTATYFNCIYAIFTVKPRTQKFRDAAVSGNGWHEKLKRDGRMTKNELLIVFVKFSYRELGIYLFNEICFLLQIRIYSLPFIILRCEFVIISILCLRVNGWRGRKMLFIKIAQKKKSHELREKEKEKK